MPPDILVKTLGAATSSLPGATSALPSISFDQWFDWDVVSQIDVDQEFEWNFGDSVLFWYRVTFECGPTTCETSVVDDGAACSNATTILTILAPSLPDVCQQITDRGITGRVTSISRFSRAAFKDDQQTLQSQGVDQTCNTLVPQVFCQLPQCLEFCLDFDVTVSVGADVSPASVSTATGGTSVGGSARTATSGGVSAMDLRLGRVEQMESPPTTVGEVYVGGFAEVTFFQADLNEDPLEPDESDALPLPASVSAVRTGCDCEAAPSVLWLGHNLSGAGVLADFLSRNAASLPSPVQVCYHTSGAAWQYNVSLAGVSQDGTSPEVWDVVFEWLCSAELPANPGGPAWCFSSRLARRVGGESRTTRILMVFLPAGPCEDGPGDVLFSMSLDTTSQVVSTLPATQAVAVVLRDGIGLFLSPAWMADPTLSITVATSQPPAATPRISHVFS